MSRIFNKAWCMFEQSGTFKNEFIKLGIPAVDLDIMPVILSAILYLVKSKKKVNRAFLNKELQI